MTFLHQVLIGKKSLIQKISEATRCNIINLYNRLNGIVDWEDLTRSITIRIERSISGTYSFLDAQFRFISRAVLSLSSGSNLMSACICLILNLRCKYNLCTWVIPSEMFLIFRGLILLPVENMMCREMVLRKLITLIYMRSQKIVISLYI